jgi:hypothetical protein
VRLALERMDPETDVENFVKDYGTGNQIPDPPAFINYSTPEALSSSTRPTTHPARFSRVSEPERLRPTPGEEPVVSAPGVGTGGLD